MRQTVIAPLNVTVERIRPVHLVPLTEEELMLISDALIDYKPRRCHATAANDTWEKIASYIEPEL